MGEGLWIGVGGWLITAMVTTIAPSPLAAQEIPVVAPGHESLNPERIQDHHAVWRLIDADGAEQGLAIRDVARVVHMEGEPALAVFFHMRLPQRSALDISYLDAESLLPFARYVTGRTGMWVHFQSGERVVASFTRRTGGEPVSFEAPLPYGRFNGGVVDLVLGALPLSEGYTAELPMLGASGNPDDLTQTMTARVVGRRSLTLPDGSNVETWRVDLQRSRGNRQIMYVSTEAPYLILREVLDHAGEVIQRWELTSLR